MEEILIAILRYLFTKNIAALKLHKTNNGQKQSECEYIELTNRSK